MFASGRRHYRALGWILAAFVVFAVIPTTEPVRHVLRWPLIVHDEAATRRRRLRHGGRAGERRNACGRRRTSTTWDGCRGSTCWPTMRAATTRSSTGSRSPRTEWTRSYLAWLGVARGQAARDSRRPERPSGVPARGRSRRAPRCRPTSIASSWSPARCTRAAADSRSAGVWRHAASQSRPTPPSTPRSAPRPTRRSGSSTRRSSSTR